VKTLRQALVSTAAVGLAAACHFPGAVSETKAVSSLATIEKDDQMTQIINLQNTPNPDSIATEAVRFDSNGVALKGTVYKPSNLDSPAPAVIVTGAWTTVKEQMPGAYARELAERGFVALAFDFTGWGESEGDRRYVEDPAVKTADILAATEYMVSRADVDSARLAGLGICASSGYMAEAAADSPRLSKLALVAPWLHNPEMAEGIYGGRDAAADLIAASDAAEASSDPSILTAASTTDSTAPMYEAPYYTETERGLIPAYDNKFSVLSWRPWLTYDTLNSAERLSKPTMMVGSSGMALPAGAAEYEKRMNAPLRKLWFGDDVSQFDFYDRADIVTEASDAIAEFLKD
jgi:dienelactone hydrolase